MNDVEILESLLDLAAAAGIEVRLAGGSPGGEEGGAPASGVCRVRGEVWVVLARAEPAAVQIDVLAGALRDHAAALLEGHYLPPAVRARIEGADPGSSPTG